MNLLNSIKKNYANIMQQLADWDKLRLPSIAEDKDQDEYKTQLRKLSSAYKSSCYVVPRDYRIHFKLTDELVGMVLDLKGFKRDPETKLHSQHLMDEIIDAAEAVVVLQLDASDVPPPEPEPVDPNVDEEGNRQLTVDAAIDATPDAPKPEAPPTKGKGKFKDDPTQVAEAASEVTTTKMTEATAK